jgi:hypothetical protein
MDLHGRTTIEAQFAERFCAVRDLISAGSHMRNLRIFIVLLCCAFGGCATVNQMAFDKKTDKVDLSRKSVVLMTLDVYRPDKSRFEPVPLVVNVEKPNAQSKQERQNFKLDKEQDTTKTEDGHTLFLVRMALEPGPYKLMAVTGLARAFPINGFFQVPLVTDFNVQPQSLVYIGRVSATLRSRESGEFRAGPLLPLIDQAIAGMSNSTWDVTIGDQSDKDLPVFQQMYPALSSASIVKAPLPPFDRAAVQRWWENNAPKDKKENAAGTETPSGGAATAGQR